MKVQKIFSRVFLAVAMTVSVVCFANDRPETEGVAGMENTKEVSYQMPEGTFVLSIEGYSHEVTVENAAVVKWTVNGRTLQADEYPHGYVFFYGNTCENDANEFVGNMQHGGGVCLQKISVVNHAGKNGVVILYDKTASSWCEMLGEL